MRRLTALALIALAACSQPPAQEQASAQPAAAEPAASVASAALRIATFNVSLYRAANGALAEELAGGTNDQLDAVFAIIRDVDPDILVLNEVDYDEDGSSIAILAERLGYAYSLALPSNTGVPTGVDLDADGRSDHPEGAREYGNDAFGYGVHPGQYAIALISKHPIDESGVRTFQQLLWKDMPGNLLPTEHYSEEAQAIFRLSSKTHADVPVEVDGETLHVIMAHPTPPGFDGPEDRNGRRNHDEIRLLTEYIGGTDAEWLRDDAGTTGGLGQDSFFFIAGDLNADPIDGDQVEGVEQRAIVELLEHPRTIDPLPQSSGGVNATERQGYGNLRQSADPAYDTADFSDSRVGNLRVDFVIPSNNLSVEGAGIFWPAESEPGFELVGPGFPPVSSDHRLVWVDIRFPEAQ